MHYAQLPIRRVTLSIPERVISTQQSDKRQTIVVGSQYQKGGQHMIRRTKLSQRQLPSYTKSEEITNTVTHILGIPLGITVMILTLLKTVPEGSALKIIGVALYGISMICVYSVSAIYHGIPYSVTKKVLQVVDHCTIYFLISGTYTPILLNAVIPRYPMIGWGLLIGQWGLGVTAAVLTAIDLQRSKVFSKVCYILMGWSIIFFLKEAIDALTLRGFMIMLGGGISYTIGAILFGIGSKVRWMHSIFHIFVLLGSLLQFIAIYLYVL